MSSIILVLIFSDFLDNCTLCPAYNAIDDCGTSARDLGRDVCCSSLSTYILWASLNRNSRIPKLSSQAISIGESALISYQLGPPTQLSHCWNCTVSLHVSSLRNGQNRVIITLRDYLYITHDNPDATLQ